MAGLVPAIHSLEQSASKPWMPGTSAATVTEERHLSKPLADRIALVTGASRGIGRATALALAQGGRACGRGRAHGRRARRARRRDQDRRRLGHARAARPQGFRTASTGSAPRLRALPAARRAGRQCRHPGAALAARPCGAEGLGRCDGHQRHRQLAPDPFARSAAAALRGRARGVRQLGRAARRAPIGVPIRSRRPRSSCWRAPMRPKRPPRRCGSICSIRGRPAPACARPRCPARTRTTLEPPEPVAERSWNCACRSCRRPASGTITAGNSNPSSCEKDGPAGRARG